MWYGFNVLWFFSAGGQNPEISVEKIKIEEIQDLIEASLNKCGYEDVYESFSDYRDRREKSRLLFSDEKKMHWHIDYLLKSENTEIRDVLFNISEDKIECDLASIIAENGEGIAKFGCSDCNCKSHLIYFSRKREYTI